MVHEDETIALCTGAGGGGAGVQPHTQSFDLVKIRAKSQKIRIKSLRTFTKSLKI